MYKVHKMKYDVCYVMNTQGRSPGGGVPQVHVHPHFQKKKINMNKQNFDLTFLGKFFY